LRESRCGHGYHRGGHKDCFDFGHEYSPFHVEGLF
jgi:hypothetical protein